MINEIISTGVIKGIEALYGKKVEMSQVQVQKTRAEFEGDYTVVVFPFLRFSKKKPEDTAAELGEFLKENLTEIGNYNVIKGFLNLVVSDEYWLSAFQNAVKEENFGIAAKPEGSPVVIEYSSPNTNKPLHLGHVRNNLLGWSLAEILKASGKKVYKVNLVNDRGIHICKSMLAWQKWGKGVTPQSSGIKGDKLVGDFYVMFDKEYKKEIAELVSQGMKEDEAVQKSPLLLEAKAMLKKWEEGDPEVRKLWATMNGWVYEGFDVTYKRLGIDFDKIYYESDTYLLGKKLVDEGLEKGVFYKKEDGSVWADLRDEGLDEKLLLRADGTSVYITQDLGTAQLRYDDYKAGKLIYVVGNEQIYHFDVLKILLKKLGKPFADNIFHFSYGMVELPHGKMKSREGTVVDADDLMEEMVTTARKTSEELGKFDDFDKEESKRLFEMIGLGALKYFILKVDPKKTMMFNPAESIDFNGNTGPFIQYTHARIRSVMRKATAKGIEIKNEIPSIELNDLEKTVLILIYDFPQTVMQAAEALSPAQIAGYAYNLAKEFNRFYHDYSILNETDEVKRNFRLSLTNFTGQVLKSAMGLLGIELPERM
jgi:arginyl-tRNA synthetase